MKHFTEDGVIPEKLTQFCLQLHKIQTAKNNYLSSNLTTGCWIQTRQSLKREKATATHSITLAWPNPMDGGAWWARWEMDTTERLHFHFSLSCIGEGNGNTLQCSCLENPRDVGASWAAVSGVARSRTRLKRLSSSSHLRTRCFSSFVFNTFLA